MKFKLMEGKALAKLIGEIGTGRVTLDQQVQAAAIQCIGQSIVHRNTTPANSLLEAVSKHHVATVVTYLEKFGNFEWNRKEGKLAFREVHMADKVSAAIEAIGEAKWYDAKKPAKVISQYDALEILSAQFDKLFKASAKGITIINKPILEAAHAAFCDAVAKRYQDGDKSVEQLAIDQALEARSKGTATPAMLAMLAEHYGRPVTQVEVSPSAKEFGGQPAAVNQ